MLPHRVRNGNLLLAVAYWGLLPELAVRPLEAIRAHLPAGAVWNPVAVPVRAGQATIHHSHVLHGSDRNRSARWRRACVLNYMGAHVRVADGSAPLLQGVPLLTQGAVVEGLDFPIVFDAGANHAARS